MTEFVFPFPNCYNIYQSSRIVRLRRDLLPELMKPVCLAVLLAMVLLIGVTPVSAQPMAAEDSCDSFVGHSPAPVPSCCVTACPLGGSGAALVPPSTNSATDSRSVLPVRLSDDPAPEAPVGQTSVSPGDMSQALAPPGDEFRCRDCLKSEEPPLI